MNINWNAVPEGYNLPKWFNGKRPLDVEHCVIDDAAMEPSYKTLCRGGTYEIIPLSAFVKDGEEDKSAPPVAPSTEASTAETQTITGADVGTLEVTPNA